MSDINIDYGISPRDMAIDPLIVHIDRLIEITNYSRTLSSQHVLAI
jgi:hypothetical protein